MTASDDDKPVLYIPAWSVGLCLLCEAVAFALMVWACCGFPAFWR